MKDTKLFSSLKLVLISLFLTLFLYTPPVYADMITTPGQTKSLMSYFIIGILVLFLIIPIANSFIEAYIAKLILSKILFSGSFVKSFLKINFISYYPAMILVVILNTLLQDLIGVEFSLPLTFLIVEFLIVIFEFFLIRWQLNKLYLKSLLPSKITDIQTLKISLLANLASFLIGSITIALFLKIPFII